MKIPKNSRFVLIGDSITDCDRARGAPIGSSTGLGNGYVSIANALVAVETPSLRILMINRGISGDTIRDLDRRWDTDVIALRLDWLSVMIGVNDVWRAFDVDPEKHADAVPPDEYEERFDALLARTRPKLSGLVLLTPFVVHPDRADPMRMKVEVLAEIVKRLAAKHTALLVDTQAAFDRMLEHVDFTLLAEDHVHPTLLGHTVIASALLEALR